MIALALETLFAGAGLAAIAAIVATARECAPALRQLFEEI